MLWNILDIFFTFEVFQELISWLNFLAAQNNPYIFSIFEVSQLSKGWLNSLAQQNIMLISFTFDISQLLIFWLKAVSWNMPSIYFTFDVFHILISWLNLLLKANMWLIFSTWLVSHVSNPSKFLLQWRNKTDKSLILEISISANDTFLSLTSIINSILVLGIYLPFSFSGVFIHAGTVGQFLNCV